MLWEPSADLAEIWSEICRVEPRAATLMNAVVDRLITQDVAGWEEINQGQHNFPADYYLIRHGLPLAELSGWPSVLHPDLIDGLALHFWWGCCWRHLDNLLDTDVSTQDAVSVAATSILRAARFHQSFCCATGAKWADEAIVLINLVCATASREREQPIPRDEIWKRAAPFYIVPRTVFQFDENTELAYRAYINARGLAHDIDDLFSDIKAGIHSLPSSWLTEAIDSRSFRRETVAHWFERAYVELEDAIDTIRKTTPIQNRITALLTDELERYCRTLSLRATHPVLPA
jgi:hypothetical protein